MFVLSLDCMLDEVFSSNFTIFIWIKKVKKVLISNLLQVKLLNDYYQKKKKKKTSYHCR